MSVAEIKEKLHNTIDSIGNETFLEALLTIASAQTIQEEYKLSDDEISILEERHERYKRGEEN